MVDLLDRVLGSAHRAEAIAARLEIRLEDRLENQLDAGLHAPVARGRNPQSPQLARGLRDHPLTHGQRAEPARLEIISQLTQELLAVLGADRAWLHAIDTSRSCSSIAPHTIPADRQEGRVADEIEQVIKPTIRPVGRPSVQLGLDLQYPRAGLIEARPRRVGVHRRPPGIPATALPACWVPSPCGRLSRPRTTTDPPSRPGAISRQRACPPPPEGGGEGDTGTVPTFTTSRSTGSAPSSSPSSIATSTPQPFLAASPPAALRRLRSPRPLTARAACAALRPTSTRLEPASLLRGFNHWFTSVTPFRLAQQAQAVW